MFNVKKLFIISINSSIHEQLLKEDNISIIKNNTINENKNIKNGVFLSFRVLNGIYFIFSIIIMGLYLCNDFFKSTFDLPDFVMFTALWLMNLICNWFAKPSSDHFSKKRFIALFINFCYSGLLLSGTISGYFFNKINDCSLFTGAENCNSIYTLFMFIVSIFLFLITLIKIFS